MDKVVLISIPETTLKNIVRQAIEEALESQLQNASNQKTVFNFKEACEYIGISTSYGYKLTSKGQIPFSKRCGKNYFDKEELDDWLLSDKVKDRKQIKEETLQYLQNKGVR